LKTEEKCCLSIQASLYLDGTESTKVAELAAKYPENWFFTENLKNEISLKMLGRDEFTMNDQTQNGMLYHQRRILDDGQLLFFVNSHTTKKAAAEITVEGKHVSMLDPVSGKIYSVPAKTENGKVTFKVELSPVGSALFTVTNKKADEPEYKPVTGTETVVESTGDRFG
jgi:hypothetical protein